ncbi:MAG: CDP-alcohol phosphatidyltransferase family protein [Nanoarchaeota archaeon]
MKKENIYNIPNLITLSRVFLTIFIVYGIISKIEIIIIAVAFVIGMLTDFFDGQIARGWKLVTEFGRKFDMIADRILMIGTALAFIVSYNGIMTANHWIQIFLIMSREILTAPFFLYSHFRKSVKIPRAKFIGKLTTFMQGVAFPLVIMGIFYEKFEFSIYLAIATGIIGILSGLRHMKDLSE